MRGDIAIHPAPVPKMTPQRRKVLEMIAEGLSNQDIAELMGLTANTVKSHVQRMFASLGVRDRAHAVGIAHRCGLLGTATSDYRTDVLYAYRITPGKAPATVPRDRLTIRHLGGPWWSITRDDHAVSTAGEWDPDCKNPDPDWASDHRFTARAAIIMARYIITRESASPGLRQLNTTPTPRKELTP